MKDKAAEERTAAACRFFLCGLQKWKEVQNMETISFEVRIVKRQTIRITLTGSNIGRPRDYIYFVGAEDAEAFANNLEASVTGAHYSTIDHCPLCGEHIYRQSRLSQLRDGRIVHTKCFDAALGRKEVHRSDCKKYYFHFFPSDAPLYDYSNLITESRACRLRYAIQAVSLDCIHLYLMESYACVKHHFCLTLKQCLDLVKEIRKTLKEFRQNEESSHGYCGASAGADDPYYVFPSRERDLWKIRENADKKHDF